jgi:hypothetical protein
MFLTMKKKEIVKHHKLICEILFMICLMIYMVSCFLPCYSTEHETANGYYCLLGGWFCLFVDLWLFLIWSSNILFFCSFVAAIKYNKICIWLSLISVVLSISMLFHRYIIYDIIVPIKYFHIGYYLWCASYMLLFIICIFRMIEKSDRGTVLK